jgi:hypothetical protein
MGRVYLVGIGRKIDENDESPRNQDERPGSVSVADWGGALGGQLDGVVNSMVDYVISYIY